MVKFFYILFTTVKTFYQRQIPGVTTANNNNNGLIQDCVHPDDHIYPTYEMTPGLKPFTVMSTLLTTNSFQGRVVQSWVKRTQG